MNRISNLLLLLAVTAALPLIHAQDDRGLLDLRAHEPLGDDPLRDGPGGFLDTSRMLREAEYRAGSYLSQLENRLAFLSGRLEAAKNPRAFELADQIRNLLASARAEIEAHRPANAFPLMGQADILFAELGRISLEPRVLDNASGQGWHPDLFKDLQRPATAQNALMDAYSLHKRLQDHLMRLKDRPGPSADDDKTRALQSRIQDLLDKCKEALASGKTEAARELALKAEAMLAELHLAAAGGMPGPIDPGRRRLEERIQHGLDIIRRRSGGGADAERLAAASSHLDEARTNLSAGNPEAAEGLLKQAEKILGEAGASAGGKLSAPAFDRLRAKLEKAAYLVSASGNEKASRIQEKAMDHFAKAERYRSEGQSARAEIEMDISLKLAAKAVDIARAARR